MELGPFESFICKTIKKIEPVWNCGALKEIAITFTDGSYVGFEPYVFDKELFLGVWIPDEDELEEMKNYEEELVKMNGED